jgi:hypothetical protein
VIYKVDDDFAHMCMPVYVVSNLNKHRLIYDARALNLFLDPGVTSYPSLSEFLAHVERNDWLVSTDAKACYHTLRVPKNCRKYMCFRVYGQTYALASATFGICPLSSIPSVLLIACARSSAACWPFIRRCTSMIRSPRVCVSRSGWLAWISPPHRPRPSALLLRLLYTSGAGVFRSRRILLRGIST